MDICYQFFAQNRIEVDHRVNGGVDGKHNDHSPGIQLRVDDITLPSKSACDEKNISRESDFVKNHTIIGIH